MREERLNRLNEIYGSEEEAKFAAEWIDKISDDLELREKNSLVFNGIPYSRAYEYNIKKAINYAPPRSKDDREVSMGLVHEKIISFCAIFLKYVYKRRIKCYQDGELVKGMGKIYDLAIEYSYDLETFKKKVALIYWELFSQGNAFVLEDWEVKTIPTRIPIANGKELQPDQMDYTFEFLDGLTYKKGEEIQTRRAVSRLMDGRQVIFGNPETEDVQEQPRITIEAEMTKAEAKAIFGTLKRWKHVPKTREQITSIISDRDTLFASSRTKAPEDVYLVHYVMDRENNYYNVYCNGVMMLPSKTPLTLFYPRGNYPISNIPAERLKGSIYARSTPAKTKFNDDFVNWMLKMTAQKFEQGVEPALLAKGKYTITRDMLRGGQVTHGVTREDFEKADPDNKGVTQAEFSFMQFFKEIIESQTVNQTFSGEVSSNATATEIAMVDNNQMMKLAYLLDGIVNGFTDMAMRRAETIESKYTVKQKETVVDGKKINVYQNFTINTGGVENVVKFDDNVGSPLYDEDSKRAELFHKAFKSKKEGSPTEYYLVNPQKLRDKKYHLFIELVPEKIKDNQLQKIEMFDEFTQLLNLFGRDTEGGAVSTDQLKKEYLEVSGKPDELFTSNVYKQLEEQQQPEQPYDQGSFGKPTIKKAMNIK